MRTVLITGPNRGIGLELARQLLERGDRVVAACRTPQRAEALARLQGEHGARAAIVGLDVTDRASVHQALEAAMDFTDRLDWLVNNAGIGGGGGLKDPDPGLMTEVYRTNAIGPVLVSNAFLPLLEKGNRPMIFILSSRAGSISFMETLTGRSIPYAYAASKSAVNMIGTLMAGELKDRGIGVVLQSPGWVRTDMGGENAHLSVEESVASILQHWEGLSIDDTGRFFGEDGEPVGW